MAQTKKISTELQLLDKFLDTSGDAGTSGQVLSSTATGINWIDGSAIPGGGGTVTGTGTANYLSKWATTTSLTNSQVYANSQGVSIGTTTPSYNNNYGYGDLNVENNVYASSQVFTHNSTAGNYSFFGLGKSSGTGASPTIVQAQETIGSIGYYGYDGADYRRLAYIDAAVDGTPAAGDMPGRLRFATAAVGASSSTERMRIDSAGVVLINNSLGINVTSLSTGYKLVVGGGDISANQAVAKISLGQLGSQGDSFFGASGLGSPTVGSQDYGFYSAHNAYRTSTGAWKHSRTSAIGAVRLLGGGGGSSGNSGFSFDYSANNGSSDITWTSLMQLSTAGNLQLTSYGAGTLVTDASGNITVSSGGGAGGPYLPVANPTFTGTLTGPNATFTGQLQGNDVTFGGEVIVNDNFVNYEFTALDNVGVQYWLLCLNAGANDVNGTLIGDRSSGHHQAMNLDIVVSAKSASMQTGMLTTKQVLESNEKYTLVTLTYNSISYVAIKYDGHPYPITNHGYFTGLLKSTIGTNFLLAVNGASVSAVAAFSNANTKATIQADKVGIGTADPSAKLHVDSSTAFSLTSVAGDTLFLSDDTNPSALNGVGASIGFSGPQEVQRQAAIAALRTGADHDHIGLAFYTHPGTSNDETIVEQMRITDSGNVGIGTTSPSFQLSIENHATTTSVATMEIDGKRTDGNDGAVGELIFSNNGDTFATVAGVRDGADNKGSLQFQTQGVLGFATRMTIATEGEIILNQYTLTQQTANSVYLLGVDSSGKVVQSTNIPSGTGGSAGPYLPLSAGSSYPLTGTLYGTSTNFSGSGDYAGSMTLGTGASTAEANLQIGQGRTGNGFSYIDLIGDATYTDYGFRMLRGNTGPNALSILEHRGTGSFEIKTAEAAPIVFETTGTERMRITSGGYVGIGITSNTTIPLHVDKIGSAASIIKVTGSSAQIEIQTESAGDATLYMRPNITGNKAAAFKMTAGTVYNWRWQDDAATPVVFMKLDQNPGTLTVKGDVVAYGSPSDERLKENIKPIESALDKVSKLQGVTFDWKESDSILDIKEDIGFIAQDVQKVVPELVRENEDGMLSMRHQGIAPILLEAIKELKAEIDLLKSKSCNCK